MLMRPEEFDIWEQKRLAERLLGEMDSQFSRKDFTSIVKREYNFISKDTIAEVLHAWCDSGFLVFCEVEDGGWAYVPVLKEDGFADGGIHTPSMFDENGEPV